MLTLEVNSLEGDPSKAKKELGWESKISFEELVKEMIEHDIEEAKREAHLQDGGFQTRSQEHE